MANSKHKIMYIEDDNTQSIMYELEFKNFGYNFIVANNGKSAIKMAKKEQPDLIFLDIMLGDMDGVSVLKQLKSNKRTKKLKIIMLTNLTKNGLPEKCKKIGAIDFIVKSEHLPRDIVEIAKKYIES